MAFWAKKADDPRPVIAQLKGRYESVGSVTCFILLAIGAFGMLFAILNGTNAIVLTAYGTIWTGWNVLFGIGILNKGKINFIIYQGLPPEDAEG